MALSQTQIFRTHVQRSSAEPLPKVELQTFEVPLLRTLKTPNSILRFGPSLLHISEDRPFCLPAALHKRALLLRKLGVADMRLAVKIFFSVFFCVIYIVLLFYFFAVSMHEMTFVIQQHSEKKAISLWW